MFKKILIANGGGNATPGCVAVQAHGGAAHVMPEPNRHAGEARGDRAEHHV